MKYLLSIAIFLTLLSCKSTPSTNASQVDPKTDSISEIKSDTNNCRLVIMFYSIGEGIDFPLSNAFEDSIGSYSLKIGKTIDYKKTHWGREGETDFCLKLNELTESEQKDFISQTRIQLKSAKWVNIYEYYPCPARIRR